ncbi:hypothetical protein [Zavarzinella formosa]|uniref:hypothetical protein n=1 Tax=Zavarzinella formosa TaxID=360055 RepID=UPI00037B7FC8|nr:hypothetical protein [Zavarzinella formosa]
MKDANHKDAKITQSFTKIKTDQKQRERRKTTKHKSEQHQEGANHKDAKITQSFTKLKQIRSKGKEERPPSKNQSALLL